MLNRERKRVFLTVKHQSQWKNVSTVFILILITFVLPINTIFAFLPYIFKIQHVTSANTTMQFIYKRKNQAQNKPTAYFVTCSVAQNRPTAHQQFCLKEEQPLAKFATR